jgi:hypothetical protein
VEEHEARGREVGGQRQAQQARLALAEDVVERERDLGCRGGGIDDADAPRALGDEEAPVRRKRHRPWHLEAGHDRVGLHAHAVLSRERDGGARGGGVVEGRCGSQPDVVL